MERPMGSDALFVPAATAVNACMTSSHQEGYRRSCPMDLLALTNHEEISSAALSSPLAGFFLQRLTRLGDRSPLSQAGVGRLNRLESENVNTPQPSLYQPMREFRTKLASGKFCLGAGITLADPVVTEALGPKVDFFWMDLEHSPLSLETLTSHLIAARSVGVPALVRVPASEPWFIKRVIDSGAPGVIIPQIRNAAEVRRVVDACRYHPDGDRGYGPRRASNYGYDKGYLEAVNRDLFVAVQIEHREAMAELDAIAGTSGLDSLVLGPFDLSLSMGMPGQVSHPEIRTAIRRVVETARRLGLFVGMGGPALEDYTRQAVELGVQWLQVGSDFEYMLQFMDGFLPKLPCRSP